MDRAVDYGHSNYLYFRHLTDSLQNTLGGLFIFAALWIWSSAFRSKYSLGRGKASNPCSFK